MGPFACGEVPVKSSTSFPGVLVSVMRWACRRGGSRQVGEHVAGELLNARVDRCLHTVAVDSKTHKAYFPLKNLNGAPVLRIMVPPQNAP